MVLPNYAKFSFLSYLIWLFDRKFCTSPHTNTTDSIYLSVNPINIPPACYCLRSDWSHTKCRLSYEIKSGLCPMSDTNTLIVGHVPLLVFLAVGQPKRPWWRQEHSVFWLVFVVLCNCNYMEPSQTMTISSFGLQFTLLHLHGSQTGKTLSLAQKTRKRIKKLEEKSLCS